MSYREVVDLSRCRHLLARWVSVKERITVGNATGIMVCIRNADGTETIEVAGCYEQSPADALKASMRMSWEATRRSRVSPP